jgi:putative Holliday junction resolvase
VSILRILGLDVGEVRIGVAVSDETGLIAQGLTTIHRTQWKKDLQAVMGIIEEYGVNKIVIGNPINMNGTAGAQTDKVKDFIGRLKEVTAVEIALWDERLSSLSAERVLIEGGMQRTKRKKVIDKLAAVIILQNYLDHQNAGQARLEDSVTGEDV